jgi:hypothetical protein
MSEEVKAWRVIEDRGDGWGWIVSGPFIQERDDEMFDIQDAVLTEAQARLIASAPKLQSQINDKDTEIKHLRDTLEGIAEGDCYYRDNCPTFGSRHGECYPCKCRRALEESK